MSIPSLLVYQAVTNSKVPIWSNICERFFEGVTRKKLFTHTQNAVQSENFCSNREFLVCLKYMVLELSEKMAPKGLKTID